MPQHTDERNAWAKRLTGSWPKFCENGPVRSAGILSRSDADWRRSRIRRNVIQQFSEQSFACNDPELDLLRAYLV